MWSILIKDFIKTVQKSVMISVKPPERTTVAATDRFMFISSPAPKYRAVSRENPPVMPKQSDIMSP